MPYLNREDILKAEDLETREVEVPEWGGTVRVRALSGYDRDAFQASTMQIGPDGKPSPELGNATAKLVSRAIVDEDGVPLFNELDVGRLGQKSAAALQRVFQLVAQLSGLADKAVEVATENLDSIPSGDSISS